ncbi:hypothetical protein [Helicobacter marmotae]|uniref:Uncharacterized protein n=1 Tax=Helicobacter marmotae TaxID=152490 RepID=A0A3D8I300_9HELI|nr:hypothetical protein [Helicobacter marmotae]RDU59455.1 hypothetical protein CQA63_06780 [Helicobacter marmotae]
MIHILIFALYSHYIYEAKLEHITKAQENIYIEACSHITQIQAQIISELLLKGEKPDFGQTVRDATRQFWHTQKAYKKHKRLFYAILNFEEDKVAELNGYCLERGFKAFLDSQPEGAHKKIVEKYLTNIIKGD